ncbi:bifunctional biotin--[acetyl-CoA-carboxylase] ligase/biotin operon repressor BirA [Thalassotalea piscium]|uniref:Bifunctional ligase/repressor BirA n=1 Tax=Thalassotalea piscium TaxID=1230533 RepID=A0A7X0NGA3_9GAMM|nr:bifunctional biotin--[acetyl-CoA-carboxylase] ligase/biotin operon repressor BirA [Thalassotalea piscium]MBB6542920.1 BirA family biotin operon repressor/biotin-[acetyl-CoA-carboxylase] ligase [Thalassotalea piscium]
MAKSIKEQLIRELAAGKFVSGQLIGESLGISRAAVSKQIASLNEIGFDIFSVTGKGYRLAQPIALVDKTKVLAALSTKALASKVEVHCLIDSTNNFLLRRLPDHIKQGQVCIAEHQSAGRGRRGKEWVSPFGSHVYMSMYWYLEQGMSAAMGLSVVAAIAISDAIESLYQIKVQLKWPNDIYINEKKLAGILIDLEGQALEPSHCVIGLGVNVSMPEQASSKIDQPWTDLQTHVSTPVDRNILIAEIISKLTERLHEHQEHGIVKMLDQWFKLDLYLNKPVKLVAGEKVTYGLCRGINTQGALLLEVERQIKPVYGGEVSLRKC